MRHYRRRNICMHAWLRMYMYVGGGHAKKHAYVALLVLIFLCKSSPTHIYVRTFVCMHVFMCVCVHVCMYIYMYRPMYTVSQKKVCKIVSIRTLSNVHQF